MTEKRQLIPLAGLLATIAIAGYMVVQRNAQAASANLTNAVTAAVRDAQGQVVLRGQFVAGEELATITADRRGRAEVELDVAIPGSAQ